MAHRWQHTNPHSAATQARRRKYATREHRNARATWARQLANGNVLTCWRCQRLIVQGMTWHVGHDDVALDLIRGPEHAACNISAAGRKGNAVARGQRGVTVRRAQSRAW